MLPSADLSALSTVAVILGHNTIAQGALQTTNARPHPRISA